VAVLLYLRSCTHHTSITLIHPSTNIINQRRQHVYNNNKTIELTTRVYSSIMSYENKRQSHIKWVFKRKCPRAWSFSQFDYLVVNICTSSCLLFVKRLRSHQNDINDYPMRNCRNVSLFQQEFQQERVEFSRKKIHKIYDRTRVFRKVQKMQKKSLSSEKYRWWWLTLTWPCYIFLLHLSHSI